ncbi:unnamed protein product [Neospora caninum Liverpool]|uniref:Toxoplasma gondii family A protein n=1 Tax=Neospora caninum (strain Liverpool) TaxID=572307 RepID=F0VRM0_NEOCL|nr:uncharacterized protein NCLIV_067920 [Neospora caninum Liverpool]CBZ56368.1 unnamed protein product [Neospora caninum Liverpool]CEL71128.1 TPA: hypothetical protein BN1204_067920 [Neospora caninum Liverpool]|eukprot:XP_003886393.1 uncharacterized protein NCLIV_067920 [Neospora caninum Liverpool]
MESLPLRAFWLTVLIGGFLPCVLCDTSDLTAVDPDFTLSIPKDGLPEDLEEVFFLQPAGTLRVIDETGSAVYMPQMSTDSEDGASARIRTDSGDASSETYSAAYAFVNGKCDFTKEIQYKDAFPGYSQPIWVRTASADAAEAKASSGGAVANFTLTNPPEEYLTEVVSFCVRFKTVLAAGSSTTTTTPTTGATQTSKAESSATSLETPEPTAPLTPAPPSGDSEAAGEEGPSPKPGEEGNDGKTHRQTTGQTGPQSAPVPGVSSPMDPEQRTEKDTPLRAESHAASPTTGHVDNKGRSEVAHDKPVTGVIGESLGSGEGGAGGENARARRLSETGSPKEAYLTIVVHSAAWGLAGGVGALSAFVLCIASAVLSTF